MTEKISYEYDEFIKHQQNNTAMPRQLNTYCAYENNSSHSDISEFGGVMRNITSILKKGDDPNDVGFRNYVKFLINSINQDNYSDVITKLNNIDTQSEKNIHFLITELNICAIRCPISVKGFTFQEDPKYKCVPELCADVIKHFVGTNSMFHDMVMKLCQQRFLDFVDVTKSLDENNENMSDNFKGFMTFMGLLYSRGIINLKTIIDCMNTIRKSIYCSKSSGNIKKEDHTCKKFIKKLSGNKTNKSLICFSDCNLSETPTEEKYRTTIRKHIECINLHKGYEHLMSHVIKSLTKKATDLEKNISNTNNSEETTESLKIVINKLSTYMDEVTHIHQDIMTLNRCYRSPHKNQNVFPLRPYIIITHNSLGTDMNKITDLIKSHSTIEVKEYVPVPLK
jgi:hypothetical protein